MYHFSWNLEHLKYKYENKHYIESVHKINKFILQKYIQTKIRRSATICRI